jgi:hypothetical protein
MNQPTLRLRKTAEAVQSIDRFSIEKLPDGNIISRDNETMIRISEQYKLSDVEIPLSTHEAVEIAEDAGFEIEVRAPASWTKGQLLNVRNRGEFYVITLLGEEDEPPLKPAPNGALRFMNTALCQDFISTWYSRESHDPRAR